MNKRSQAKTRVMLASAALALLGSIAIAGESHAEPRSWKVLEIDGVFEHATGPEDLPALSSRSPVTPRMLMAYGQLPPQVMTLALALRTQGIDILSADVDTLVDIHAKVRAGEIEADGAVLDHLIGIIQGRGFLEWSELEPGSEVQLDDDTLVRGRGELLLEDPEGAKARLLLSGETVPAARISPIEAPSWGEAPGIRTFRSPAYLRGRVALPLDAGLAAVVPAPQGGYLAAITLVGQTGGPQTVFMRRDGKGRLLWSSMPTAGTHLLPEVLLPVADAGYLVAGTGPVIRFDDQGRTVWRIEPEALDALSVTAAARGSDSVLLAGRETEDGQAVLVAIDGAGTVLWRTAVPGLGAVDHLVALDGGGWALAGTSAEGETTMAVVDAQGEIRWQAPPDSGLAPSAVEAMGARADLGVILAGQADGGGLWLRRLDPETGDVADFPLGGAEMIGAINAVHAVTFDASGDLLIGGEARTENAWLARVGSDGQVAWFREYGLEDVHETLLDVHPVGDSLVALGRLRAGSPRNLPEVWVMQADESGKPLAYPPLPEPVAEFAQELQGALAQAAPVVSTLGDPEFHVGEDGTVDLALPWLTLKTDWDFARYVRHVEWVVGDVHAGLGSVKDGLRPVSLRLPEVVEVRDPNNGLAGRLGLADLDFDATWDQNAGLLRSLNLVADDVLLDLHPQEDLMGAAAAETALAQAQGQDVPRSLRFGHVALKTATEARDDGLYDAPLTFTLRDVALDSFIDPPLLQFGRVEFTTRQTDMDLAELVQMGQLREQHQVFASENPIEMFGQIVSMVGNPAGQLAIEGLRARGDSEKRYLQLDKLDADLGLKRAEGDARRRDLWARLNVEGLGFSDGDRRQTVRFDLGRLAIDGSLEDISPLAIIQLVLASVMSGEVDEPTLLALSQQLYSRFAVTLDVDRFSGLEEGSQEQPQPFGLEKLRFGTEVVDLDSPAPSLSFSLAHDGLTIPPVLIAEDPFVGQLPRRTDLALDFLRMPSGFAEDQETVQRLKSGELDPDQLVIEQMLANKTLLDIPRWEMELPDGLIALAGRVWTEAGSETDPGRVEGVFDLRIVNLDAIAASWMALAEDESQREEIEALMAMVRLLGEKRENGGGLPEHVYRIEVDTAGKALVNGEDLKPLLNQLGG
ncbi:MAG: hypothetical protein ACLFRH_01505 [Halothiobacillaceae bacterium]